jgi:hypothetical protein
MGLTEKESGRLILLSLTAFVVMFAVKMILPLPAQPFLVLVAVFFIALIYVAVPSGRGSLDFKVGLIVGCVLTILAYEIISQILPPILRGVL